MATKSADEQTLAKSEVKYYNFTETSFIKREIPAKFRSKDSSGQPVTQRWLDKRFFNEAAALELLSKNTTIPVPKLLSFGRDEDGYLYLQTQRITGSVRCDMAGDQCRMPGLHDATQNCDLCKTLARQNANRFVQETVLPQLQKLKSNTTGLNRVVIPPRWVEFHDRRDSWPVRTSETLEFVFCLNDLTAHNIMLDSQTLEVVALFDLEDSGFFPKEIQQWKYSQGEFFDLYEDSELVNRHISLIAS